jgi:hypothetical protein
MRFRGNAAWFAGDQVLVAGRSDVRGWRSSWGTTSTMHRRVGV